MVSWVKYSYQIKPILYIESEFRQGEEIGMHNSECVMRNYAKRYSMLVDCKKKRERRDRRLLAEYAEASEHVSSTPVGL